MINSGLFRRHFTIAAIFVLGFIVIGALLTPILMRQLDKNRPEPQAPIFFARLIEQLNPNDPVAGLKSIQSLIDKDDFAPSFAILGSRGELVYPSSFPLPRISEKDLPAMEYESKTIESRPHPPGPFNDTIIALPGNNKYYLFMNLAGPKRFDGHAGPPPPDGGGMGFGPAPFLLSLGILIISVLVGIGFSIAFIFRSLREKVLMADQVISSLQAGNLKARFPTGRSDEIGQAMDRFNRMAEEIERLVERLRATEQSRTFLLQELAHDLRTPVASLGNLLETLQVNSAELSSDIAEELITLALKETEYFGRLVEDLLLLGQVSEPKYRPNQEEINFIELLEEEIELSATKSAAKVKIHKNFEARAVLLVNGDSYLLRRALRNALENAISFAKSDVYVFSAEQDGELKLTITDNGPGFTVDALTSFGERKSKRSFSKDKSGRLSVGLGSVIMKIVLGAHGGSVKVKNQESGGAIVEITIPLISVPRDQHNQA